MDKKIKKVEEYLKNINLPEYESKEHRDKLRLQVINKTGKINIIKNSIIKIAAAAVIIVAIAMFVMLVVNIQTNQQIKIPAELTAMSAEELVNLNYHPENSNFSPEIIKAALRQALDNLSPEQVLEVAKSISTGEESQPLGSSVAWPAYPMADLERSSTPFPQVVESTDIFIKARLLNVTINVDDIKQALLDKQTVLWSGYTSHYRVSIQLEVLEALPEGALEKGMKLEVPTFIDERTLDGLEVDAEYFVAMMQTDEGPRCLYPFAGVFNISKFEITEPEVLWKFFSDALNVLLFKNLPSREAIDYWTGLLNTDYYKLAIEYMKFLPDENLSTTILLDSIETKLNDILEQIQPDLDFKQVRDTRRRKLPELEPLIKLLLQADNKEANERLVSILSREDSFLELLDFLPDDLIPAKLVIDAFERRHQYVMAEINKIPGYDHLRNPLGDDLMGLASKASEKIIYAGDKESMKRLLSLLEEDIELGRKGHLFRSLRTYNKDYIHTTFRLLMALDNTNPGERLMEIYKKYKDIKVVYATYENPVPQESQEDYAHALMVEIIEQAAAIATEDVYAMLYQILQSPSASGIQDADTKNIYTNYALSAISRIWEILGLSSSYDMKPYLVKFIADPNLSNIGLVVTAAEKDPDAVQFEFERAAFEVLRKLPAENQPNHKELINMLIMIYQRHKDNQDCKSFAAGTLEQILQPDDTECIPILQELLLIDNTLYTDISSLIANKLPASAFVETLISAFQKNPGINLLKTMAACGGEERAIALAKAQDAFSIDLVNFLFENGEEEIAKNLAISEFEKPVREDTLGNFRSDIDNRSQIISFLGKSGDASLAPIVKHYTDVNIIDDLLILSKQFSNDILGSGVNKAAMHRLEKNAIISLANLTGKDSISTLRNVYKNTHDKYVQPIAALCLYYLGDNTGQPTIELFLKGTYVHIPEIQYNWWYGDLFEEPIITSLRSERTDALLLEKLRNYVEECDGRLLASSTFLEDYKSQILPIMVNHLNSRDRKTRSNANKILKEVTGRDFGFDPEKYHGYQDDIIQKWREYIEREY